MLIRQKITNLNDEYHHIDPVGMFGVLTDASGNVLHNYVYDAFSDAPYKRQYVGESFPSQSKHTGSCQSALSEPGILTGSGGRGVVVPSRGFQVMGKKPAPAKKHPCKSGRHKVASPETPVQGGSQIAVDCCLKSHAHRRTFSRCIANMCWAIHYGNPQLIVACENNAYDFLSKRKCKWHWTKPPTAYVPDPYMGPDPDFGEGAGEGDNDE